MILAAGIYFFRTRKNPAIFCIALGCVTHVLLDTMWANPRTFLWPLFGWGFQHQNISIGHWVQDMLNLLVTKPGYYIPEAIGAVSLGLFYFSLSRNGKISRLIKSRLRLCYPGLFGGRRQKHAPIGLVLNKETGTDLAMGSGLVEKAVE